MCTSWNFLGDGFGSFTSTNQWLKLGLAIVSDPTFHTDLEF